MPDTSGSNPCAPVPSDCRRIPTASISSMKTMHWPPHLRASRFARRASTRTTIASIPMNVAAKPEPGIEMNGELKPVAIAFASIVLPVPGRAEEEQSALALPAGALEVVARLPDIDDAAHLLLRLRLAPDVVELDAPLRVARLERLHLRQVHHQQRAEHDREVREEEEEDEDGLHPQLRRR